MNMMPKFEQHGSMEMRQEQILTHQQIQALELLTTPVLELEAMINSELERNPVLEGDEIGESPAEADGDWLDQVLYEINLVEDARRVD